jgi:hypothetical protein
MSAILFNETNPNLNLNQTEKNQSTKAFKIREQSLEVKADIKNDIEVVANSQVTANKKLNPLEKLKNQITEDFKANGGDSKDIKRSFSRGLSHRVWTQGLSVLGGFMAGDKLTNNLLHAGFPFEMAYQTVNRTGDKLGGSLIPELAKSYESDNGSNKNNIGSMGHIAAKTTDHVVRGVLEPAIAATLSRGISSAIHTARGTGDNQTFLGQWKDELTKGGDFGKGELVDEISYYGGLDLGIHAANALGLKKTWSGAALASTIAAAAYSTRDPAGSIFDANNPGAFAKKFVARAIQRLGVMGHIYALPLPFMDSVFPASKDKSASKNEKPQKSEAEIADDKKLNFTSRASEALYALITFSGLSALYAYQNKKS